MIRIDETPFDPIKELDVFAETTAHSGGVTSFIGNVRSETARKDDGVKSLYLEHYPGATERSILKIAEDAKSRFELDAYLIIHRVGDLAPGEPIVLVAAAAAHRREAFEAVDFIMDYLKTKALFWKKEKRVNSEEWIEPRAADYEDAARW